VVRAEDSADEPYVLQLELSVKLEDDLDEQVEETAGMPAAEGAATSTSADVTQDKLSPQEEAQVSSALGNEGPDHELLQTVANIPIRRRDMRTLRPRKWLNDEVINAYLKLLESELAERPNLPRTYIAPTLLYTKLAQGPRGYYFDGVRRWTRRWNVDEMERVIVPICVHNSHWVLAVIHLPQRTLEYYDSLGGDDGKTIFRNLTDWLADIGAISQEEARIFQFRPISEPAQRNYTDCGVFILSYALCRAVQIEVAFTQEDMEHLRRQIVLQILKKRVSTCTL
jgi:sentrin-specific protease 1